MSLRDSFLFDQQRFWIRARERRVAGKTFDSLLDGGDAEA